MKTGKNADELFKNNLDSSIKAHIPHKTAKVKDNLPWISLDLKRLIKKRDRYYKTMKKSNDPTHKSKFKHLKRAVQRNLGRAYWSYIENIVTLTDEDHSSNNKSMKRFWAYIKQSST